MSFCCFQLGSPDVEITSDPNLTNPHVFCVTLQSNQHDFYVNLTIIIVVMEHK